MLDEVNPADYQGVIFCGADVGEFLPASPASAQLGKVVVPIKEAKKVVGAICTGQEVLLRYGLLQGKTAALCPQFKDRGIYAQHKAQPTDQKVVRAENFVTAAGPADADAFADAIAAIVR